MDLNNMAGSFPVWLKKYRPAIIVILAGVLLMLVPKGSDSHEKKQPQAAVCQQSENLEQSLQKILSRMDGAGEVQVLLTEARGEETRYQCDEEKRDLEVRKRTVLVTGREREEAGLVRQIIPPTYLGAVVLCQGADRAAVRLAAVRAVTSATGLTTDKVTVLKMK